MIFAGEAIVAFTTGRTRQDLADDLLLRSAVERQFEILGEALRRLALIDPIVAGRITEHRRIIDFRNAIAHGYDSIDPDIVWQAV
ncbi:MAG: HepT-like ribonuclease domain-containing protein [Hyphomicrobiaceae bacterium]|nr:HepT-like ribonuclease domain-containing protein [Hyphomicrobiaceae bacterium]